MRKTPDGKKIENFDLCERRVLEQSRQYWNVHKIDAKIEVRERLIEVITIVRRSLNRDQVLLSRSLNERFKHKKTANLPTMTRKGYSSDNYHVE